MTRAIAMAALALLASHDARAAAATWVRLGDDVRVIDDPAVEVDVSLALIRSARHTIDFATYDIRPDESFGLPLASALRAAADRGVRVRVMNSWSTQSLFDRSQRIARVLLDPPARVPVEVRIVGGPALGDSGYGLLDSVHEKLLLIDGRALVTTGRGVGEDYQSWLDTAFAVRGPLVAQTAAAYESLWRTVALEQAPFVGFIDWHQHPRQGAPVHVAIAAPDAAQRQRTAALLGFLLGPRAAFTDPPSRGRVLHHDLLRQLRALAVRPIELDVDERTRALHDPVIDALVARLATARSVRITLISAMLHPALRDALIAAARRGAHVTLFVDTHAPRFAHSREPVVSGGSVWAVELPDLDELLTAGVHAFAFQIADGSPWLFLHRKLAVIDDVSFFGSHNFNLASTVADDELAFEIQSAPLAAELAALFDADLARNGLAIDPAFVREERARRIPALLRWLSRLVLGYM